MGYCDYLKNLLRPLGIYDLSETGRYLVYVRATDRFGNSYVDQVTLVVID